MPKFSRTLITGNPAPGTADTRHLEYFLAAHPDALVLDSNPHANISGYASTVADEISLILEPLCLPQRQMTNRVENIATQLGITQLLGRNPLELSGGQTQLVALASLLAGEPRPLLLHSLLQGLDQDARSRVLDLLGTWQADILWTNPAQPYPEELEAANQIIRVEEAGKNYSQEHLPWNIALVRLIASDLSISPTSPYRVRKKRFWQAKPHQEPLLNHLNLTLEAGSFLLIQGPNGAGKSTFVRTLAGLLTPLGGQVEVGGRGVHHLSAHERVQAISMVGQYPRYRMIGSNLRTDLLLGPAGEGEKLLEPLARALGLEALLRANPHPHDLSVAEQTLASIINALLVQPSVLVLDEPTANLGVEQTRQLIRVLESYRAAGGSLIVISHDDTLRETPGVSTLVLEAP